MTKTGAELLTGLSKFLNDYETGTTTSAGNAGGTTLIDTYLKRYQDNRLVGRFVRVTSSGSNQYTVEPISTNAQSTGTVTLTTAFSAQIGSGVDYELHRYDPVNKFRALDEARYDMFDGAYQLIYDETTTADGRTMTFSVPSAITEGPISIWEEVPVSAQNLIWNFVSDAIGDSTSNWTASNCTATVVNIDYTDLIVPKYDYAATKIVVAGSTAATYKQTVANMANDVTATKAAGRDMAFGMWVYCNVAGRVTLTFEDDSGTTSSSAHAGNGWELLTVEKTIVGNNSTTLTIGLAVSSDTAPITLYWNRAWLYYGNKHRITDIYQNQTFPSVRHDSNTHTVTVPRPPMRGHQLRMVGQGILSALGSSISTQVTNTMEVSDENAQVLYAGAARLVLEWEGLTAADVPEVYNRIQLIEGRARRMTPFKVHQPTRSVNSPYWS